MEVGGHDRLGWDRVPKCRSGDQTKAADEGLRLPEVLLQPPSYWIQQQRIQELHLLA